MLNHILGASEKSVRIGMGMGVMGDGGGGGRQAKSFMCIALDKAMKLPLLSANFLVRGEIYRPVRSLWLTLQA